MALRGANARPRKPGVLPDGALRRAPDGTARGLEGLRPSPCAASSCVPGGFRQDAGTRKAVCDGTRKTRTMLDSVSNSAFHDSHSPCLFVRVRVPRNGFSWLRVAPICGSNSSIRPLLDSGLWIGRKVYEQPESAFCQPQIVHQLRPVLVCQGFDGFDFDDDLPVADEVRNVCLVDGFALVEDSQFMLCVKRDAAHGEFPFEALLIDFFPEAVAEFTIDFIDCATDGVAFFWVEGGACFHVAIISFPAKADNGVCGKYALRCCATSKIASSIGSCCFVSGRSHVFVSRRIAATPKGAAGTTRRARHSLVPRRGVLAANRRQAMRRVAGLSWLRVSAYRRQTLYCASCAKYRTCEQVCGQNTVIFSLISVSVIDKRRNNGFCRIHKKKNAHFKLAVEPNFISLGNGDIVIAHGKFAMKPNFISLKNGDIADYIGSMCWRATTKAGDAGRRPTRKAVCDGTRKTRTSVHALSNMEMCNE